MRPTPCLVVLILLGVVLAGCEQKTASSTVKTAVPAAANDTTSQQAVPNEPNYVGTYTVQDTAVCALTITISKQANGYRFATGTAREQVRIELQDTQTYFTFVGLKGAEPHDNIEAVWQDSMLLIQNYGNSMNEYTRFEQCDAKFLELVRQQ